MSSRKRKISNEHRVYNDRWESDYLITNNNNKLQCIVCMQILSVPKEYNVKRHYTTLHEKKFQQYTGESRNGIITDYKKKLKLQTNFFKKSDTDNKCSIAASYEVALEIVKAKKPFSDGVLIKNCAMKMAKQFNETKIAEKFATVSVSHQTIARRVEHINQYVSKKLHDTIEKCKYFSLCLDESTDLSDISQLIIFVRTIQEDFSVAEEMLDLIPLHGTTKGTDIFEAVNKVVSDYGGFDKCSCIVTDGARAMIGTEIGFAGLLKRNNIHCPVIHCIVHQEALCGKSLRQSNVMKVVVKITNIIRGGNRALTHRKFRDFLAEVDATYGDLLLHTDIRWLSAGNCLQRFFSLRKEIPIFLKNDVKSDTTEMENQMVDAKFLSDLAFLTDLTSHLNELNLKLQGKQQNIAYLYGHIRGFQNKIKLFKSSLEKHDFSFFPSCKEHFEEMQDFEKVSYLTHIKYIDTITEEFENRFSDFKKIEGEISVFTQPLTISVENVSSVDLQLELCDLQSDPFYQGRTEIGLDFFKLLPGERYPNLRNLGLMMGSMLGSTYLCESSFSNMKFIKSKYRCSLSDNSLTQLLRLSTTNINVNIDTLVSENQHPQTSH